MILLVGPCFKEMIHTLQLQRYEAHSAVKWINKNFIHRISNNWWHKVPRVASQVALNYLENIWRMFLVCNFTDDGNPKIDLAEQLTSSFPGGLATEAVDCSAKVVLCYYSETVLSCRSLFCPRKKFSLSLAISR